MEALATDGFILKWTVRKCFGESADWIDLARDSDQTNTGLREMWVFFLGGGV